MSLQRKVRTTAQLATLRYKQTAPIGIGATVKEARRLKKAHEVDVIIATRDYIWATRPVCQLCRGNRYLAGFTDEMHEEPPRSRTRGLPPDKRFNPIVCGRLCAICHRDVTEHRLRIVFADRALGFLGRVWAEPVEP